MLADYCRLRLAFCPNARLTAVRSLWFKYRIPKLTEKMNKLQKVFKHLPKTVIPLHYDLQIKPDLKELSFSGSCKIQLDVKIETSEIILNALDLEIFNVLIIDQAGNEHKSSKISLSPDETATFNFPSNIVPGKAELQMDFTGEISKIMKGFYQNKYKTLEGEERFAGVTQFQATHARRAFPCWDEPEIKSTFNITLTVPADRIALSNMNIVSEKNIKPNLREVKFATTPLMSTYILAWIVGEYDYVEEKTADGIPIRIYTPLGKKEQGKFALEVALKSLKFYTEYFKIPYPLPKMDLITLKALSFGAMENWGLITYRENCLLIDPDNTSTAVKQNTALTIAHEIAHMWFGNLVTMKWWSDLWLNEGFASFMENLCVHHLFPEYDIWTQFVSNDYMRAMELDALESSHPIEVPVEHPDDIGELVDDISYRKGASVIRMLHNYIGKEQFKTGMNIYLSKYLYKNTETEDLWNALEEANDKPIQMVISTWTKQKGYPMITVSSVQDGDNRIVSLSQKKFSVTSKTNDKTLWMIPVSFSKSTAPSEIIKEVLFNSQSLEVTLEGVTAGDCIKLNPGTVGLYRVLYSKEMLNQLFQNINFLPPLDRLGMLNDVFSLAKVGFLPTAQILKYLLAFTTETSYVVWASINDCMASLNQLLSSTDFYSSFQAYCQRLYSKIFANLGWLPKDGESHMEPLLRSLVLLRLISAKDENVILQGKQYFEEFIKGTKNIPADLRSSIYRAAVSSGDEKTFKTMRKLYQDTQLVEEKIRIGSAMASTSDPVILRKVLEFSISDSVETQNSIYFITSASLSKTGREITWKFFQENFEILRDRHKGNYLGSVLVKTITENFVTEEKAKEVEAFFDNNEFPGTERGLRQAIETIYFNANWLSRDERNLKTFLSSAM